jgi:hypothetical protein
MRTFVTVGATLVTALSHRSAAADGFVELFGGRVMPVADRDYNSRFDETYKLGTRFGAGTRTVAIEASLDFSPMNDKESQFATTDMTRVRILGGGRLTMPIGSSVDVLGRAMTAHVFGRFAGGLDLAHVDVVVHLFGPDIEDTVMDFGLALELGGGLMFDVGQVSFGGQVALPMAMHFNKPDEPYYPDLDYTGIDLDLTFVASLRF